MKHSDSEPKYEATDIDSGGVSLVAVMLVLGLIFCSIVGALYYQALSIHTQRREGAILPPLPRSVRQFPPPQLQVSPAEDLAALQTRQENQLTSYGWVDKEKGVVRIPIDRAMDLLVERDFPGKGKAHGEGEGETHGQGPTWEEIMQQRGLQGAGGNAERNLP